MNRKQIAVVMIPLKELVADENQPRKLFDVSKLANLKSSIASLGIKLPLTVEKVGDKYQIINGERRFRAATELGLKEVPCVIEETRTPLERMVEQFHIQEQNEGWSNAEKAMVVVNIAREYEVGLKEMCQKLSIPETTARRYTAFGNIISQKEFERNNLGLQWATNVVLIKQTIKNYYRKNHQFFGRETEKAIELAVIRRVIKEQIPEKRGFHFATMVKDVISKEPEMIKEFLEGDTSVEEMFAKVKALGAASLRNSYVAAGFLTNALSGFLKEADVVPTTIHIARFKKTRELLTELLDKVE